MTPGLVVRLIARADQPGWRPLWDGYNAFYSREGPTALPEDVTATTWERFFDPAEPVHALVATQGDRIVGLVPYLFHRATSRLHDVCYLNDLFTVPAARGQGVARALIEATYAAARAAGSSRVYWSTQTSNLAARALYDQVAEHRGFIIYSHEL